MNLRERLAALAESPAWHKLSQEGRALAAASLALEEAARGCVDVATDAELVRDRRGEYAADHCTKAVRALLAKLG